MNPRDMQLPLLPVRGLVVFPYTVVHFDVGRKKSLAAVNSAMSTNKLLFLTTQVDDGIEEPNEEDMNVSGTVASIKQVLKLQNGVVRVLVEGLYKADLKSLVSIEPYYIGNVIAYDEEYNDFNLTRALARQLKDRYTKYSSAMNMKVEAPKIKFSSFKEIDKYVYITSSTMISILGFHEELINKRTLIERIEFILEVLDDEIAVLKLEDEIAKKTKDRVDKQQREYYLRQQIKTIQYELGMNGDIQSTAYSFRKKTAKLDVSDEIRSKLFSEIDKFENSEGASAEISAIRTYIETVLALPWNKESKDTVSMSKVKKVLESSHFGLEDVKERILEFIAIRKLNKGLKGPILCLVGPPGVGKTSIAKAIAESMNRKFVRMSLGGVRDEAEIRGHRRTYIGSIPGRIISNMKDAKVSNPVFLLDEIDKMASDHKGDPASAMLEVLDPEQNSTFKDHYLEVEYDLSKVLFVTTANTLDTIPGPLRDRMEVIEVAGYTDVEKLRIAKDYLVQKQLEEHGIDKKSLKISQDAIKYIIEGYTRESGVRSLQRMIGKVCRKAAVEIVENPDKIIKISVKNIEKYIGKPRYKYDDASKEDQVGVVTGLAWTQYGGDTLPVEVSVMKGSGKLNLTGKLGEVMQESAKIGYSYVRANASKYGIDEEFYKKLDIHIHAPEGAVPKDGPSAGVTMITAMISALSNTPIRADVAMTGEVTLTGSVLAVGGIKEKALSAYRSGIRTIILPEQNKKDVDKIPSYIKDEMEFIFAKKVDVVLDAALRGENNDN
ncbi:endopeptidase La [Clostridium sp.]|uniref:endopeptidase La n=1 Tax=Clostridium sp. TaxID=1506 RepID=UPI003FA55E2A